MCYGFDKRVVAHGPAAIGAEMARGTPLIKEGDIFREPATRCPRTFRSGTTVTTESMI
jgi:hypothetical protein